MTASLPPTVNTGNGDGSETSGPWRQTYAGTDTYPPMARAYSEVATVVREAGLMRRARWFYAVVGAAILVALGGIVTGVILLGDSWFQLFMAAALGIVFTQIAFLGHEAAHRTILVGGQNNDRLARILSGIVGLSYAWWDSKHSRHHANPNKVEKDPDIDVDTISFLQEDAVQAKGIRRLVTMKQGWLFFPLLAFEGYNLHALSLRYLLSKGPVKGRALELSIIGARFALLGAAIFLIFPVGLALAFFAVQLAVFGVYMGASFAPNHKGMPIVSKHAKLDFFTKQVRTSRNVSGGWWATTLMGGLNYQVEHHLFPSMPRIHLARTREIVREACDTHGVPYTETTLWKSYGIVIRYLNDVGLAARDPFECPMVSERARG